MLRSTGARFLIVGLLVLLMFIPMFMVKTVVGERDVYAHQTLRDIGREWGGEQIFAGPYLRIPVSETVEVTSSTPVLDAQGNEIKGQNTTSTQTIVKSGKPIYLLPENLLIAADFTTQVRHRGIYNVPVYSSDFEAEFHFDALQAEEQVSDTENIQWDKAEIVVSISSNKALRGEAILALADQEFPLEPRLVKGNQPTGGVAALIGDPRGLGSFKLSLGLNGAQKFQVTPAGRNTSVTLTSDWPHPSFNGAYLPDSSDISESGFEARWNIPHLARSLPQASRSAPELVLRSQTAFGFETFEPNDFYQKAHRSAAYAVLFIALTFLTVLLVERGAKTPAHPVQYLFIGLAQMVFVLLMVAYSEHLGFFVSYVLSAAATIALITFYGAVGLKLQKRTWVLAAVLIVLYAVLYFILGSVDFALLAGSTLAFAALAAAMIFTRNEDWYTKLVSSETKQTKKTAAQPSTKS